MSYILRPYQEAALNALHEYICVNPGNPCLSLPTGSGKSIVMASVIKKWKEGSPWVRGCVLAHRKELVQQNYDKMCGSELLTSCSEIGIFSNSLRRKDFDSQILFASIDSIYRRSGDFPPFDFIFVDEAHRIPFSGEGKYRTFINGCKRFNKDLKIIGWTATPFRMAGGTLCHKDHILNEICYEAKITDLINDGFLCNLRSKVGLSQPELKDVKRNTGGDYILNSLEKATNKDNIISSAVAEAARIIKSENRKAVIFFCVSIEHCMKVSAELHKNGIIAPFITGKTSQTDRDRLIHAFRVGLIHAVCNVNVLTEGFDVPHIDCIVLLRPTLSAGLFSQMVGRGLRPHVNKTDCLTLDFAGCIEEHGPIDLLGGQITVMVTCKTCQELFSRALRACPVCGWEVPKQEIKRLENVEHERRLHGDKASQKSILSNEPETHKVDAIYIARHVKPDSPDSIRIQFRCGLSMFRMWCCLDHPGYAGQRAQAWWRKILETKGMTTVDNALCDLFLSQKLLDVIKTITVRKNGKYYEIIDWNRKA